MVIHEHLLSSLEPLQKQELNFSWNLRQEYWSGTGVGRHFLLQGNLSDPEIEPGSSALQAKAYLPSKLPGKPPLTTPTSLKFRNSVLSAPRGQARGGHQGAVREHTCPSAAPANALP